MEVLLWLKISLSADRRHKMIRSVKITDASEGDPCTWSQSWIEATAAGISGPTGVITTNRENTG